MCAPGYAAYEQEKLAVRDTPRPKLRFCRCLEFLLLMLALETVSEFDTEVRIDDLQSNCRQPGWLKRQFQKPQDSGCRGRSKAADLAFEGIARPKMSGARDHEPPHE